MKRTLFALTAAAALLLAPAVLTPANADVAAMCKDGSQWTGSSNRGACSRHGGVQQWLNGTVAQLPQLQANNTAGPPVLKPAAQVAATPPAIGNMTTAANANGQGWVNLNSRVYHCAGDRYYGKTKTGEFLSESQAIAQGFRADHGKSC